MPECFRFSDVPLQTGLSERDLVRGGVSDRRGQLHALLLEKALLCGQEGSDDRFRGVKNGVKAAKLKVATSTSWERASIEVSWHHLECLDLNFATVVIEFIYGLRKENALAPTIGKNCSCTSGIFSFYSGKRRWFAQ